MDFDAINDRISFNTIIYNSLRLYLLKRTMEGELINALPAFEETQDGDLKKSISRLKTGRFDPKQATNVPTIPCPLLFLED